MEISEDRSAPDWSGQKFEGPLEAALFWYAFSLLVIPTVPGEKRSIVKWAPWLSQLSLNYVRQYWTDNPLHEVAAVIDDRYVVFDADSPESQAALIEIEQAHGIAPALIVKTSRGLHHWFRRPADVFVKTDSRSASDAQRGRRLCTFR